MRLTVLGVVIGAAIGVMAGVGGYTFIYAKGYSYLTNDPGACANCHMMAPYYSGWLRGPHRSAAVCNDCHTPHDLAGKYLTKSSNGFRHSFYFTSGRYPDNPQITKHNREVIESACRRCHADIVQAIDSRPAHKTTSRLECVRCHSDVGHM